MEIVIAAIVLLVAVVTVLCMWAARRSAQIKQDDPKIDELITKNKFSFREGMNTPDWSRVKAIGQERWDEAVRAQERLRSE